MSQEQHLAASDLQALYQEVTDIIKPTPSRVLPILSNPEHAEQIIDILIEALKNNEVTAPLSNFVAMSLKGQSSNLPTWLNNMTNSGEPTSDVYNRILAEVIVNYTFTQLTNPDIDVALVIPSVVKLFIEQPNDFGTYSDYLFGLIWYVLSNHLSDFDEQFKHVLEEEQTSNDLLSNYVSQLIAENVFSIPYAASQMIEDFSAYLETLMPQTEEEVQPDEEPQTTPEVELETTQEHDPSRVPVPIISVTASLEGTEDTEKVITFRIELPKGTKLNFVE